MSLSKEISNDLAIFNSLRDENIFRADIYEKLTNFEIKLHSFILDKLMTEYGKHWWREGIPESVRIACAQRFEQDPEFSNHRDPNLAKYSYTTFTNLLEILISNWNTVFGKKGNIPNKYLANKKLLQKDYLSLNSLRNYVMHPIKTKKYRQQEDFNKLKNFVVDFERIFRL